MLNKDALKDLEEARLEYEKKVADVLSRYGESTEPPSTTSDIPLKSAYTPEDLAGFDYLKDLGFPGEYPYTRGVAPLGYRTRAWPVRQVMGVGTKVDSHADLRKQSRGEIGFRRVPAIRLFFYARGISCGG